MLDIGIVGADSTHTENFAAILNRGLAGGGMRAVKLWGADPAQARAKAAATGIPQVVDAPQAAMEGVDAVMVLNRWGADHFAPAMQAVERRLPLFVDKPLCDDPAQAIQLTQAAHAAGVPLLSASAVRYDPSFQTMRDALHGLGRTRLVTFTLPQTWRLYGVHAVDAMHVIFGPGAQDVTTVRGDAADVVTIRWPDGRVGVATQVRGGWMQMLCVAVGDTGWTHAEISDRHTVGGIRRMYVETIRSFHAMLTSGEPPIDAGEMVSVIRVVAAAERAARTGRRVALDEIPSA